MKTSIAHTWGSTSEERALSFPCDHYLPEADAHYFRAVDVDAQAPVLFRWLCQLRVAPYSYDWIDNLGRRSPRQLSPGLDNLETGQRVMTVFNLVEFEADRHLTLQLKHSRLFGSIAVSYLIVRKPPSKSRLVVKLSVRYPRGRAASIMRILLPWGDLVMMRKQLLTLKELAEAQPARSGI